MSKTKTQKKNVSLQTTAREDAGSRASRRLRRAGKVPVNLYGHGQGNVHLAVDAHEFDLALHTASQLFTLEIGGQSESCLLKEVQYDTFGQQALHADFERVDLSEEVEVEVHLEFVGTAKGLAEGGQLVIQHDKVAVKCRADSIPELIEVDVSGLALGEGLHAGELKLPPGVSLDAHEMDAETQIVGVVAPHEEEPATPAAEEGAEPELVSGEKPAEGGEGEAASKKDAN
jgi:large subunit ribosomal protein L25